jgi:hypothetical protein
LFNEWTGSINGTQNPATVTMNANMDIIAYFVTNHPPATPAAPIAPEIDTAGTDHTITAQTTDADSDQILYFFDFGDGTNSSWLGPYASGAVANATHTWATDGQYQIKVKAKDVWGNTNNNWSEPTTAYMTLPTRMYGLITTKTITGNITSFNAKFVFWIRPGSGLKILKQLETIVVPANHGFVGKHLIAGKFNAALILENGVILSDFTVKNTRDLTSTTITNTPGH